MKKEDIDAKFATGSTVKVVFIKADGTERTMICTTHMDTIPKESHPKGTSTQPPNPDVKKVYSIPDNGWRSFRYDSVISCDLVSGGII